MLQPRNQDINVNGFENNIVSAKKAWNCVNCYYKGYCM